ncbi:MAG: ribonuclease P [Desulfurococcaceae archaeon]
MKRDKLRDLALQRVEKLYEEAIKRLRVGDIDLARRYVEILLKISAKARLRPPKQIRRGYCRKCKAPLIPGLTARVRLQSEGRGSRVVLTCTLCNWTRRYMYKVKNRLLPAVGEHKCRRDQCRSA